MAELFGSARIVDAILALVVIEAVALALWRRRARSAPRAVDLLPNLLAGAALLLALRAALVDSSWPWIAAPLAGALVAHVADLHRRGALAPRG